MKPTFRIVLLGALALVVAAVFGSAHAAADTTARPRLVVVISVDQLRADYIEHLEKFFLPAADGETVGGFRYLMDRGADFIDAHQDHFPLYTGPGHAAILTGAFPYKHGIVGNGWYDRSLSPPGPRNCVEDPNFPEVGGDGKGRPVSPMTLRVTTVGDELKMATGGRAKVWGLAFKDRAAVLMAGHLADGALWGGWDISGWVTSTYYARDGKLPDWVARWNAARKPESYFGRKWELSIPREALDDVWPPGETSGPDVAGLGAAFPHVVKGSGEAHADRFYSAFGLTPFGNEFLVDTAEELIRQEHLGEDTVPDILALGFSTNDGVGHVYGANSPEVADITVQTDRQLSRLFNFLRERIPGGLSQVTIVVTADHGASPTLGVARDQGLPAGFMDAAAAGDALEAALDSAFGEADWIVSVNGTGIYVNLATVAAKGADAGKVEQVVADTAMKIPGVYAAYTRHQILTGAMPDTEIARVISRSYHPAVDADVIWVIDSLHIAGEVERGATHGAPYDYDTSVPLLLGGFGIRPGRYADRVSSVDIAPTLSAILGTLHPSGCEGKILGEALSGIDGPENAAAASPVATKAAAPAGAESCASIEGLDDLLAPGNLLMFGELHGTRQSEAFVSAAVCRAARMGRHVTAGLELPRQDAGRLASYMASDGGDAAKKTLLSTPFWSRTYQDGRSSGAMLGLIDDLRAMRQEGLAVKLLPIDPVEPAAERDKNMADLLVASAKASPDDLFVVLTGNLHNRTAKGSGWMGERVVAGLPGRKILSLDVAHTGGTAWMCLGVNPEDCGTQRVRGRSNEPDWRIELFDSPDANGFHGVYHVGSLTASPPARDIRG